MSRALLLGFCVAVACVRPAAVQREEFRRSGWEATARCRSGPGGWCAGTALALAWERDFPCLAELQVARDYWAVRGYVFRDASECEIGSYGVVPVIVDADMGPRGVTSVILRTRLHEQAVSVRIRECHSYVLAHELGHVLGFEHDYTPSGLMNVSDSMDGWRLSRSESRRVAAQLGRSTSPAKALPARKAHTMRAVQSMRGASARLQSPRAVPVCAGPR